MAMVTNEQIIDHILKSEGWPKYGDKPTDRGGPTKGGITLTTLRNWRRDQTVDIDDLKILTEVEARDIYRELFIREPKYDLIADGLLRWQVVDAGVMTPYTTVTKWLQEAIGGVKIDGRMGPATAERVNSLDPHYVSLLFSVRRMNHYARLARRDPQQGLPNIEGWAVRQGEFVEREAQRYDKRST